MTFKIKLTNSFKRKARHKALEHEPSIIKEGKLNSHIWRDGFTEGYILGYLEARTETIPTTEEEVKAEEERQEKEDASRRR